MTGDSDQNIPSGEKQSKKGFFDYAWRTLIWLLVIAYLAVGAAWLLARYCLTPYLNENKNKIERTISEVIDTPIKFGALDTEWAGLSPEITLKNIVLGDPEKSPVTADALTARLSLSSLTSLSPIFESVTLTNPKIEIKRLSPMIFSVLGRRVNLNKLLSGDTDLRPAASQLTPDIRLLLKQKLLELTGGVVALKDMSSGNTVIIKDITAAFKGGAGDKQFAFTITPPSEIASPISVRGLLKTPLLHPNKLSDWDANFFATTDFINFGELAKWMPDFSVKYKGIGSGSLWADFVKWSPVSASFIGALSDVDLLIPDPNVEPLQMKYLKGKITGKINPQSYELSTDDFSFELKSGEVLPPANMTLSLQRVGEDKFSGGSFKINNLEFKSISALLPSLSLPKEFKEFIAARKLSGSLSDVDVQWEGSPDAPKRYSGKLSLNDFCSFGAAGKDNTQWLPGFINISGNVSMKDGVGTAELLTKNASIALPGLFPAAAFSIDNLQGTVKWSTDQNSSFEFQDLLIENEDLAIKLNGTYKTDDTPYGTANLSAELLRGNVAQVWKYMPLVVGNETISWLRYGLLDGKAVSGNAVLRGPLHGFPFEDSPEHQFDVSVNVEDVLLDVYPNKLDNPKAAAKAGAIWPAFEKVGGVVRFIGNRMEIAAERGNYKDVKLQKALVHIPSFSTDTVWLDVNASAAGSLKDFLSYVKTSPVDGYTGGLFKKAQGSGAGDLSLDLKIPLDGPGDVAVSGAFTFNDDEVKIGNFSIPDLNKVSGTVAFDEKGASSESLSAECFGAPVKGKFSTDEKGTITVTASGTAPAKALEQIIPVPMIAKAAKQYLSGSAPFSLQVLVGEKETKVDVKSPLTGLQSKLPPPMQKEAAVSAPLTLSLSSSGKKSELQIMIDNFLSSEFSIQDGTVARAAIGNRSLPLLPSHGYAVSVRAPLISTKAWEKVFSSIETKEKSSGAVELPDISSVNVNVGLLEIDNFNQTNLKVNAHNVGNSLIATVSSDELTANFEWQKAKKGHEPLLIAHISKLFIPSSAKEAAAKSKPVEIKGGWPAINAVVDDLTYGNMRLGKVALNARNMPSSQGQLWKITKLNLSNPSAQLNSSGSWLKGFDGSNETSLLLDLRIQNLGSLLNRLDFQNLVRNGNGTVKGNLSWTGTPLGFNTESFDGKLAINLSKGEILKIQPGPAAKLLSLLTLQSLTRYLTLDFRDFYSSGFNFSTIRGDASIDDGLMTIKELTMIGSSATVVINGNVNTQKETEDLHLLVLPDINAAGASVALAVANPIVGIGSFLAQLIFKDPLSKLFSFEYSVTGTWSDPIVKKVSSHKGL